MTGKREFFIYDSLTDNAIRCFFEAGDTESIAGLIERRVRVKGHAKFTATHEPKSMRVLSFDALPQGAEATDIRSIQSVNPNITGGQDSVEYIRGLRDAR